MSEQMTTTALLRYMQSCKRDALCSITLIAGDMFAFKWCVGHDVKTLFLPEGNLYRSNKKLQREFNKVREYYHG